MKSDDIKRLREETGAGILACKNALTEANGNLAEAKEILRIKGEGDARSRSSRNTSEGVVASYIHPDNKIGVLIEVRCETDFVARTPEFQSFVKELAMHIAAANPLYITSDDVPADVWEDEKRIMRLKMKEQNKPEFIIEKIVDGQMKKFCSLSCLMEQEFVKDSEKKIGDLVTEMITRTGENIRISKFARFQL